MEISKIPRKTNIFLTQRLCYGAHLGYKRAKLVERSLNLSKKSQIKHLVYCLNDLCNSHIPESQIQIDIVDRAINTVLQVKKINPKYHPSFPKSFGWCVEAIFGYKRLITLVEELRLENYSSENPKHEEMLYELWNQLVPDVKLEGRITKQWQEIGFQGDDPATDFRGMGILGLMNLLYFAREYPGTARHLLTHSQHPKYGYTFCVVGINITHMAWRLLKDGIAKSHFYNLLKFNDKGYPSIENFHQFYCYLLYEFDAYWMNAKPDNLMQFNNVHFKFEKTIKKLAEKEACHFKMNLNVENV